MRLLLLVFVGCAAEDEKPAGSVELPTDTSPDPDDTGEPDDSGDSGDSGDAGDSGDSGDSGDTGEGSEGAIVPAEGARLLDDLDGSTWSPVAVGAFAEDGADALLFERIGAFVVATPHATGDATIGERTVGGGALGDPAEWAGGDLDGDGLTDLVEVSTTTEPDPYDPYDEFVWSTSTIRLYAGPLAAGASTRWSVALDPVYTSAGWPNFLVEDLDGDGAPEVTVVAGTRSAYTGEVGAWRVAGDATVTTLLEPRMGTAFGELNQVAGGDLDGDGFADLVVYQSDDEAFTVFPGPLGDVWPDESDGSAVVTGTGEPQILGDIDGDGHGELVTTDASSVWLLRGPPVGGALADVASARIGSENENPADSEFFATAGDVRADGDAELVLTDPRWGGDGRFRGAVYVFDDLPSGVVSASAADVRIYAETDSQWRGTWPNVLADGRVLVMAYGETHAYGTGLYYLLDIP